jgi:hypothetical protein
MKELNKFKKTLLFLNASSIRLASIGEHKDSFYKNSEPLSLIINWCLEFSLFKLAMIRTDNLPSIYVKFLLGLPFIFHLGISFIFSTDLKLIENNYNQYYSNYYYGAYCLFAVMSIIFSLYYIFEIW